MQSISKVEDEIDVVFRIQFTPDSKNVIILTRNYRGRRDTQKDDVRQESSGSTLSNLSLLKIKVESGEIDRNFYYRAMFPHLAYSLSSDMKLFAQSSTAITARANTMPANGVEIYDFETNDKREATIRTRFKWFKKYTEPYQFTFRQGTGLAYISIGSKLCEWDYTKLKEHEFNNTGNSDENIIEMANQQLDSLQRTKKFQELKTKNQFQGMLVFDITVHKRGLVATVFGPRDEGVHVPTINYMLDYVTKLKFSDLDIPKDKRVKFQYVFDFDQ